MKMFRPDTSGCARNFALLCQPQRHLEDGMQYTISGSVMQKVAVDLLPGEVMLTRSRPADQYPRRRRPAGVPKGSAALRSR
jgi:hypothetical protein